jgi:hypothetical protein
MKGRAAELRLAQSESERTRLFCIPARYWTLAGRRGPHLRIMTQRLTLAMFFGRCFARSSYWFERTTRSLNLLHSGLLRYVTLLGQPSMDGLALFVCLCFLACCICGSANDRHLGSMYMPWCLVAAAIHQHAAGLVPLLRLFAKQRRYLPTISLSVITD